jgi:membrane-associated protein
LLRLLEHLGAQAGPWFYLIAGALVLGEAGIMIGLLLPGETALIVAGFAAREGWIQLWPMAAIAIAAAVLGDSLGYEVGRRLGPRLRTSRLGRRVGDDRWQRADAFLNRYGGRAVLLGRFTAGLRAVLPGLAGMARMRYLTVFLPWNIAGAAIWGCACVLLGYGFATSLTTTGRALIYVPLVLFALGVTFVLLRRAQRRRTTRS